MICLATKSPVESNATSHSYVLVLFMNFIKSTKTNTVCCEYSNTNSDILMYIVVIVANMQVIDV